MMYKDFIQNIINTRGYDGICDDIYHEYHHIIPKCIGGTDASNNLISLTPKEHFTAHKLLVEENPNNTSLMGALVMVAFMRSSNQERYVLTNEEYEYVKSINSKFVSMTQKELHWCYHKDTLQLKRFKIEKIPKDYILGIPPTYKTTNGKKWSDEQKLRLSKAKKGKYIGKKWFNNGIIEILVYNQPNGFSKGRLPFSEEVKKHIGKSSTGRKLSREAREKVSNSKKGKHAYNNGKVTVKAYECPEGFKPGFLKNDSFSKCKFYTNGTTTIKVYEGQDIPDGFYLGMAKNEKLQGRKWYNNGKENRWSKECPDGFWLGKI